MGLGYGITVILRFLYGFFNGYHKNTTQGRFFFFFLGMGFVGGTRDGLLILLLIS